MKTPIKAVLVFVAGIATSAANAAGGPAGTMLRLIPSDTAFVTPVIEVPEGVVYCGGGQIKRQIEYLILEDPETQWDALVTVNGNTIRAMTAFSYFGNSQPPDGFVVALLGEDRSEFLVFRDGPDDWLEFGDYTYRKCN